MKDTCIPSPDRDRASVIGHRSSGIGHRSSGTGHRVSVIGYRILSLARARLRLPLPPLDGASIRLPQAKGVSIRAGFVRGATLIELTLALALTSLLCGISILRAGTFVDRMEVRGAVTEIESLFSVARHAAIARGTQSVLSIDAASGLLTVSAEGEQIVSRDVGAIHGVAITTARTSMTYSPTGVGYGAANFSMIVSRRAAADTIVISRLGRVRHQ